MKGCLLSLMAKYFHRRGYYIIIIMLAQCCAEDVPSCLAHSVSSSLRTGLAEACDPTRKCHEVSFGDDRSCLSSPIAWRTPYSQVHCCMRCCLWYWQRELGLDTIHDDWTRELKERGIPNADGVKKHGWPLWDDVIFSHMTPFAWGRRPGRLRLWQYVRVAVQKLRPGAGPGVRGACPADAAR